MKASTQRALGRWLHIVASVPIWSSGVQRTQYSIRGADADNKNERHAPKILGKELQSHTVSNV